MATSSFGNGTANASADFVAYLPICRRHFFHRSHSNNVSFSISPPKQKLRLSSKGLQSSWNSSTMVRAQSNEVRFSPSIFEELFSNFRSFMETLLEPFVKVAVDGSSKAANPIKSEVSPKDVKLSTSLLASEESISEFINQVSSLIKLVDSKDIVELQLKQLDCELLIRKKEALPLPPSAPVTYVQSPPQPAVLPPDSTSPVPAAVPSSAPTPAPSPPKAQTSKSSHPPLKCPMAGTLYRSPAPGEPSFVKIGDKVQKGQVLCIIEAMKLMNEIEADQAGTVVEILADDGKPVSVDTPLFVIEP